MGEFKIETIQRVIGTVDYAIRSTVRGLNREDGRNPLLQESFLITLSPDSPANLKIRDYAGSNCTEFRRQ